MDGISYHLAGRIFTPKPKMIQFPVCDRCNARCIMCNRWKKEPGHEIGLQKVKDVFMNPLFKKVEDVNLHGGEPTLRKDLAGICEIIQQACPNLKRLWISTNGFGAKRVEKRMVEIIQVLDFDKINSLDINVSLDGIEDTHDKIRGVKGGFKQCIETINMLSRLSERYPLKISIGTVIQPLNLYQIDELESLANNLGIPINFQPLMFDQFFNIASASDLRFSNDDITFFKELVSRKLANGFSSTNLYWCNFLSIMNGATRRMPCAFDRYVFSLYPTGEVLPCSREDWILFGNVYEHPPDKIWFSEEAKLIRKKMKKEVCPKCSFYCGVEFSLQKEFFSYLFFYLKKNILGRHSLPS